MGKLSSDSDSLSLDDVDTVGTLHPMGNTRLLPTVEVSATDLVTSIYGQTDSKKKQLKSSSKASSGKARCNPTQKADRNSSFSRQITQPGSRTEFNTDTPEISGKQAKPLSTLDRMNNMLQTVLTDENNVKLYAKTESALPRDSSRPSNAFRIPRRNQIYRLQIPFTFHSPFDSLDATSSGLVPLRSYISDPTPPISTVSTSRTDGSTGNAGLNVNQEASSIKKNLSASLPISERHILLDSDMRREFEGHQKLLEEFLAEASNLAPILNELGMDACASLDRAVDANKELLDYTELLNSHFNQLPKKK